MSTTRVPDRSIAIALALFLGGVGIHWFYLGRPKLGIVSLFLCWTFVPAIISFFQAITWALTKDADWHMRFDPKH